MGVPFAESQTKENLMRAFAGESQARNRYTFAAEQARKEKLQAVEKIFLFTADQERAHAQVFYEHLRELAGSSILVDGSYPVDVYENTLKLLQLAQHNEYQEYEDVYPHFGDIAKSEGFSQVAESFYKIAEIEKVHGERFGLFAEMIEDNTLHQRMTEERWMCLNCGYIYEGTQVPEKCPVCGHDKGYMIPMEIAPYSAEQF